MFTAPTAFRAIKKEDPNGEFFKNYNTSSLQRLFLAGERCDITTYNWISDVLKCPVIDHWWQTESGWPMLGIMMGVEPLPAKAGSAGLPVCGYDIQILDEEGKQVEDGKEGLISIKLPLPPGCLNTLWNNDERFKNGYLSQFDGFYTTGDGGYKDKDGYFFVMGRVDDVINVAGHRLSTGEMEEIISTHTCVAECAVVGIQDELRGQVPFSFVVLKDWQVITETDLEKELVSLIRNKIGAIAYLKNAIVVKRLPKTRSGKILRKTLRDMVDGNEFAIPSTIEDISVLDEITDRLKMHFNKK
jgi:acyl-coenzyme A synthetase/AMP-(fatty) acid ligase